MLRNDQLALLRTIPEFTEITSWYSRTSFYNRFKTEAWRVRITYKFGQVVSSKQESITYHHAQWSILWTRDKFGRVQYDFDQERKFEESPHEVLHAQS